MSQDRLARTRRAIDEFNAGALGSEFDAFFAADVDFRDELGWLDNRADLRAYIEGFQEALGGLHVEVRRAQELADTLLLVVDQSGQGTLSGAEVAEQFTWLLTFRDEVCVRWQIYADHADALEAAGLPESAVSRENVDIVRRAWEFQIFGRGDPVADFAPDIVMNPVEEEPSYGRDAIRDNFRRFAAAWEDLQVIAEEFIDAGECVVVTAHFRGRGRASGITVDARLYEVYKLRGDKVVRVDEFTDHTAALRAAGLSG